MVAGKFDEARKHAHSSLQILSRHLPKVVKHKELPKLPKQIKSFEQSSTIAKQFEALANARHIHRH